MRNTGRIWRFNLRSFVAALTVLAVLLGWHARQAAIQRNAVRWVEEHDGYVIYRYEHEATIDPLDMPTASIVIPDPPIPEWVLHLMDIHFFSDVVEVHLFSRDLEELSPLYVLRDLTYLDVSRTSISKEEVEELKEALPACEVDVGQQETPNLDPFGP